MVRAVLFDLFETLVTESRTRPPGVSSLADGVRSRISRGGPLFAEARNARSDPAFREAFRRLWKARRPDVTLGRLSFREAIGEITSALGCPADELTLQHICEERLRVKAEPFLEIEDPVLSMIDHFRARGLRLGVVSNCLAEDAAAWPNCSLASRFDCAVFSFEVGLAKPNPDIYIEASRRLQIDASDTWYIGDGADEELSGAAEAGVRPFRATWFLRRWPHFRDEPGSIAHVDATTDFVNLVERALARTAEAISVSL